jgi:hypothetical protein
MAGILSNPPKSTHAERAAYNKKHGAGAWAAKIGKAPAAPAQQSVLQQQEVGDQQLGGIANEMLPEIQQSFQDPFDYGKYEAMAPVQGDYQGWVDSQMQNYNKAFDDRMNPVFQDQDENFRQRMANEGIAFDENPESKYQKQYRSMMQQQNDARTQAYAQNQGQAIEGAQSLFNVGTAAQQNALGLGQAARYGSLNDFNALRGAQSGFQQQQHLLDDSQQHDMQKLKFAAKNRGGGGAPVPAWQQMGFSSYQDAEAFNEAQRRDAQMWNWQNAPQQEGPSPWSSAGGSIGGKIANGFLDWGINKIFT